MPTLASSLKSAGPTRRQDITALLELTDSAQALAYPRGAKLRRQLTAATLRVLAEWLADQAHVLAQEAQLDRAGPSRDKLTRREQEVAVCIARGLSNSQIAAELVISGGTAERHVANILCKLGMRSRAQIAVWAVEHGLGDHKG